MSNEILKKIGFTVAEIKVIEQLCEKNELSKIQLLRGAIRLYEARDAVFDEAIRESLEKTIGCSSD